MEDRCILKQGVPQGKNLQELVIVAAFNRGSGHLTGRGANETYFTNILYLVPFEFSVV